MEKVGKVKFSSFYPIINFKEENETFPPLKGREREEEKQRERGKLIND